MNNPLTDAINGFPLMNYLSTRVQKLVVGNGNNVRVDCPNCGGRKTLSIHRTSKRIQCFRCTEGGRGLAWEGHGSLVDLIQLLDGLTKWQAIERIFEESGVPDSTPAPQSPQKPPELLPPESLPLIAADPEHPARANLRARGLSHMESRVRVCVDGRYAGRWILPVCEFGELKGFDAKSFSGRTPKSLFPEWLETSRMLYHTPAWDSRIDHVVITESIFDAETIGFNAVGIFGSVLRDGQFNRLWELRKRGVTKLVWMLDEDAWIKQINAILRKTRNFFDNYVVDMPPGSDPNSIGHDACCQLVRHARVVNNSFDLLVASP